MLRIKRAEGGTGVFCWWFVYFGFFLRELGIPQFTSERDGRINSTQHLCPTANKAVMLQITSIIASISRLKGPLELSPTPYSLN